MESSIIKIKAIFLAAGCSTRMGSKNKLLLPFKETTLVQHSLKQIQKSLVDDILIVTGHESEQIHSCLKNSNCKFIHNNKYASGMTSSIQTGVKTVSNEYDAFLIGLSDMPFLTTNDYNILIQSFKANFNKKPLIIIPTVDGKMGNPIIFSNHFLPNILKHKDQNGCKSIINENIHVAVKVALSNPLAFKDIDTEADYTALSAEK